jgi:hypothetical protein
MAHSYLRQLLTKISAANVANCRMLPGVRLPCGSDPVMLPLKMLIGLEGAHGFR